MQDVAVADRRQAEIEEIFRVEGPRIWRALVGYTADDELARDAVAEAFAQALAHGGNLRSPRLWIWKTAFIVASAELKRRSQMADMTERSAIQTDAEANDIRRDIVAALRQLSPNQRAAVILHDYADRPTREIASILGMSMATVRVHLSQGRRRLRTLLEAYP
jgi:RNA polymerase sigma factor (sigma-70 family)